MTDRSHVAPACLPMPPGPDGADLRVFCLPHAGGGASAFAGWTRHLPDDRVQLCPVQPPGREGRLGEPCATDLAELGAELADAVLPYLDLPFVLLGNSMGALVAFELARCLQQRYGLVPDRLVVAATRPPGTPLGLAPIAGCSDDEFLDRLQQRHGGIPADVRDQREFRELYLPVMRADMAMFERYEPVPGPPLRCPITGYVGAADPGLTAAELAGWGRHTSAEFDRVELPGGHFALLDARDTVLPALRAEQGLVA